MPWFLLYLGSNLSVQSTSPMYSDCEARRLLLGYQLYLPAQIGFFYIGEFLIIQCPITANALAFLNVWAYRTPAQAVVRDSLWRYACHFNYLCLSLHRHLSKRMRVNTGLLLIENYSAVSIKRLGLFQYLRQSQRNPRHYQKWKVSGSHIPSFYRWENWSAEISDLPRATHAGIGRAGTVLEML